MPAANSGKVKKRARGAVVECRERKRDLIDDGRRVKVILVTKIPRRARSGAPEPEVCVSEELQRYHGQNETRELAE